MIGIGWRHRKQCSSADKSLERGQWGVASLRSHSIGSDVSGSADG
jgi:hypothetical protein